MSRRVLVTGSAGFLGRHICRLLLNRGDEPVGLDLEKGPSTDFEQRIGSVERAESFEAALPFDAIIHGAAITDLWRQTPADFERVNIGGSIEAARAAAKASAPLVLISSYTVLIPESRQTPGGRLGDECFEPGAMIGPYARSKRLAELAIRERLPHASILRMTAPIGPGDHRLTPPMRLLRDLAAGDLPGVMRGRINIVDVRDAGAMALAALDRHGFIGLASGQDLTLQDFARLVASAAGVRAPRFEVAPFMAAAAARAEGFMSSLTGKAPRAPLDGVKLAAAPVSFLPDRTAELLGLTSRPTEESVTDAIAFLRQAELLAP